MIKSKKTNLKGEILEKNTKERRIKLIWTYKDVDDCHTFVVHFAQLSELLTHRHKLVNCTHLPTSMSHGYMSII